MRMMGLDIGDNTIGIALSDPLGWTAQGLTTLRRSGDPSADIAQLTKLIEKYEVLEVVVGLPKNMNGSLGEQANKVLEFAARMKNSLALPVHTWDERLTTVAAEKLLLEADLSRSRRKKVIDKVAAAFILQGYLDSRHRQA